jgi:hypothetical protein
MNDIFKRTAFLEINEYPRDYRDCLRQAVNELMSAKDLRDTYNLLDITHDEFIQDMCDSYLRYKHELFKAYIRNVG